MQVVVYVFTEDDEEKERSWNDLNLFLAGVGNIYKLYMMQDRNQSFKDNEVG